MSCICQESQKIPTCLEELVLGSVSELSTDIVVYIQNNTTGYTHIQYVTTSIEGIVTIDLTDPLPSFYNPDSYYEVKVTTRANSLLPLTIGDTEYDCIGLYFEKVNGLEETTWTVII
jgi:hypothetical protein